VDPAALARAVERARRLLALAKPGSGGTAPERANAAERLVETIAAHGLTVAAPTVEPHVNRSPAPSTDAGLEPIFAVVGTDDLVCAQCSAELQLSEIVLVVGPDEVMCPACWESIEP
jgi:hypothetical protein